MRNQQVGDEVKGDCCKSLEKTGSEGGKAM